MMGAVALLYFLAIVSGLILVLPRLARDLFALRAGRNRKRMWLDAHNVIGVVGLPFHVFIAISVVVFAFGGADPRCCRTGIVYDGQLDRIARIGDPFGSAAPSGVKADDAAARRAAGAAARGLAGLRGAADRLHHARRPRMRWR